MALCTDPTEMGAPGGCLDLQGPSEKGPVPAPDVVLGFIPLPTGMQAAPALIELAPNC